MTKPAKHKYGSRLLLSLIPVTLLFLVGFGAFAPLAAKNQVIGQRSPYQ